VCQRESSSLDRSLDVHVSRLRRKLASRASLIRTVRGVGYMFCPDTPADDLRIHTS
jgi:DNA-binding response OmpR family regulator